MPSPNEVRSEPFPNRFRLALRRFVSCSRLAADVTREQASDATRNTLPFEPESPFQRVEGRRVAAMMLIDEWQALSPRVMGFLGDFGRIFGPFLQRCGCGWRREVAPDGTIRGYAYATGETRFEPTPAELDAFEAFLARLDAEAERVLAVRRRAEEAASRPRGESPGVPSPKFDENGGGNVTDGAPRPGPPPRTFATLILGGPEDAPFVNGREKRLLTPARYCVLRVLREANPKRLKTRDLKRRLKRCGLEGVPSDPVNVLKGLARLDDDWRSLILFPGAKGSGLGYGLNLERPQSDPI